MLATVGHWPPACEHADGRVAHIVRSPSDFALSLAARPCVYSRFDLAQQTVQQRRRTPSLPCGCQRQRVASVRTTTCLGACPLWHSNATAVDCVHVALIRLRTWPHHCKLQNMVFDGIFRFSHLRAVLVPARALVTRSVDSGGGWLSNWRKAQQWRSDSFNCQKPRVYRTVSWGASTLAKYLSFVISPNFTSLQCARGP